MAVASPRRGWRAPGRACACSNGGARSIPASTRRPRPRPPRRCSSTPPDGHVGSRLGMFDFNVNENQDVLVGCGLGGTSLINANVSLRGRAGGVGGPALAAADPCRPRHPPRGWLPPRRGDAAAQALPAELPAARQARRPGDLGTGARRRRRLLPAADQRPFRGRRQRRRRRAEGVHQLRGLRRRLQSLGEEHDADELHPRRLAPRRRDLHAGARCSGVERRDDGAWIVHYEALGSGRERFDAAGAVRHRRRRRPLRRHPGLDRDPAALEAARPGALRTAWASTSAATATSSPSPTTAIRRSTASATAAASPGELPRRRAVHHRHHRQARRRAGCRRASWSRRDRSRAPSDR